MQGMVRNLEICVRESLSKIESLPKKRRIGEIRACVRARKDRREIHAALVIDTMRRKAVPPNAWFGSNRWTPRKMATILRTSRPAWGEIHAAQMVRSRSDEQIPPQSQGIPGPDRRRRGRSCQRWP